MVDINKLKSEVPTPEARTAEHYKKRPCRELVGFAAELLGTAINENYEL